MFVFWYLEVDGARSVGWLMRMTGALWTSAIFISPIGTLSFRVAEIIFQVFQS